ncbi:hypothetical protein CANINC_002017 [Pichia inconspicua]|uniref:5'-deoxynucleotidase n=1 Tax=Pichia inconspicua TaxID=52247 RepID=A0A4T0X2A7_9ASCO|nr:hypothetical protein CANINC_002017 [[Candida] inconspicua]
MASLSSETSWDPESNIPADVLSYIKNNHPLNRYTQINFFFQLISLLKQQRRTGWINMGIPDPESISDHMYRMSIMTMVLDETQWPKDQQPNKSKCIEIALVHDMAESLVGDIVPHDANIDKIEKSKREYKAILYICDIINNYSTDSANKIKELWIDYELQRNLEATIVKDIDKFELLCQTFEYERLHNCKLEEFYSCRNVIKNIEIQKIADELIDQRNKFIQEKKL